MPPRLCRSIPRSPGNPLTPPSGCSWLVPRTLSTALRRVLPRAGALTIVRGSLVPDRIALLGGSRAPNVADPVQ
jgi:hypothetical protein